MNWEQILLETWSYRWEILFLCVALYYRKHIYQEYIFIPLAGGNGKIQMDELAKAVLLIMIAKASEKEGRTAEQYYPDIYWIMIFTAVCTIAALKVPFARMFGNKGPSIPTPTPNTSTETL